MGKSKGHRTKSWKIEERERFGMQNFQLLLLTLIKLIQK